MKEPLASREMKSTITRLGFEVRRRIEHGSVERAFFIKAADTLLKQKGPTFSGLRLSCLTDLVRHFFLAGDSVYAANLARHALALARQVEDLAAIRRFSTYLGNVSADLGDVPAALPHFHEALSLARKMGDPTGEAAVLINLATAFNYAGLHLDAIACLERALEVVPSDHPDDLLGAVMCNLAQSHLSLGNLDQAIRAISASLERIPNNINPLRAHAAVMREFTYVRCAIALGMPEEAEKHVKSCKNYANICGKARSIHTASICHALLLLNCGRVPDAIRALELVLFAGTDTVVYDDALRVLVQAHEANDEPHAALLYLEKYTTRLRESREKSLDVLAAIQPSVNRGSSNRSSAADEGLSHRLRAKALEKEAEHTQLELLDRLALTADLRSDPSGGHGYRVGRLSGLLAERLCLSEEFSTNIQVCGRLHDIGRLGLAETILLSPTELKQDQVHHLRAHVEVGAAILGASSLPRLKEAALVAGCHHERWDGAGYPLGMSGEAIPLSARIVAIADVFDALTHGRSYAARWPIADALEELRKQAGAQFDPALVPEFVALIAGLGTQSDLDLFLGNGAGIDSLNRVRKKLKRILTREDMRLSDSTAAMAT